MHQPNYLPWIGLFSKIVQANCLIIYDNAQYEKNGVVNRNKIRTSTGWTYLSIPINKTYYLSKILDIPLPKDRKWEKDHWRLIYQNYVKTPFFGEHQDFFEGLYSQDLEYLWQLNEKILIYLLECFDINVQLLRTSELNVDTSLKHTDLMLAYLKSAGADVYISGPSGKNYLEMEKFHQNGIELKFSTFQHPVYRQRYLGFEPNMAAIDLLFNLGQQAKEKIIISGSTEDSYQMNTPAHA